MIITLCPAALLSACSGPLSTLDTAGPSAHLVAQLWWGMLIFAAVVMAALVWAWFYAMRRDPGPQAAQAGSKQEDGDTVRQQHKAWIIGGGIVLPSVSIIVLLAFGIPVGNRMTEVSTNLEQALRVDVTGHQWWWEVTYPELDVGAQNTPLTLRDEIHVPVNVPVRLFLSSADVIHSFWVPRLGGKLDMIPGRTNELRLLAEEPGIYLGLCAEFCGLAHAVMRFEMHVHSQEDFDAWLAGQQPGQELSQELADQESANQEPGSD